MVGEPIQQRFGEPLRSARAIGSGSDEGCITSAESDHLTASAGSLRRLPLGNPGSARETDELAVAARNQS
jgi:hypothetical protein